MAEMDLNIVLDFFDNGKQLNLGQYQNAVLVEYGYTHINNELILYLKGSNEDNDFIKNYIGLNNTADFYKFSNQGNYIIGNGSAKILETKEEKINGIKIIIKQQTGSNNGLIFDENKLNDLIIVTVIVENYNIIKR
jgi:hypothetical protein